MAFAGYLLVSVVLWWHVWATHPTTVTTCGCNDPALTMWFLAWPAYAIAHGHNLFYSASIFFPTGINLLSNTGMLLIGVPLAPVTWLFGPVATLNVASTLGPALTALAMFWLVRRWVGWAPAAFVAGLVFGFGPFAMANLAVAHLNTEILVLVPLMVACFDELLVRQNRSWRVVGVALAVLVTLQFFLSTEILVIVLLSALLGCLLLVGYAVSRRAGELRGRAPHALRGLAVAGAVAAVVLAYPLWFALDGPAHLSGLVWPTVPPGSGGIVLGHLWDLHFMDRAAIRLFAGYQGPPLPSGEYLGAGILIVIVAGVLIWRHDRRLWFFGAMAVLGTILSLGVENHYWVPWRLLAHVPLVQNVSVARFMAVVSLCVAAMTAIVIDHVHATVQRRVTDSVAPEAPGVEPRRRPRGRRGAVVAAVSAAAVAAVAIVPMGSALAGDIPLTTGPVGLPRWFADVGSHLRGGQVVLTYPPPVAGAAAMAWQAIDASVFALATGSGPQSIPARAGAQRPGLEVISSGSVPLSVPAPPEARQVAAVRAALKGWHVTVVVVPDPAGLEPHYDRSVGTAFGLALFTEAIGRIPRYDDDAWVWSDVQSPGAPLTVSVQEFVRCTTAPALREPSGEAVPTCVASTSRRG